MNSFDKSVKVCHAISDKKATDITVIDAAKVSSIADYFIFASASSGVHAKSIAAEACDAIELNEGAVYRREGYGDSDWVVVDGGDIIIHIFTKELREKYNLEKLWNDGKNFKKFEEILKDLDKTAKKQEKKSAKDQKVQQKKETKTQSKTKSKEVKSEEKSVKPKPDKPAKEKKPVKTAELKTEKAVSTTVKPKTQKTEKPKKEKR